VLEARSEERLRSTYPAPTPHPPPPSPPLPRRSCASRSYSFRLPITSAPQCLFAFLRGWRGEFWRGDFLLGRVQHICIYVFMFWSQDTAASKLREAQDLRVYTAITLMENFTAALNVLFDEIRAMREEALVFPTEAISLCDKMNFKQVKSNSANQLIHCQHLFDQEQVRDRETLSAQAVEFLLADTSSTSISSVLQKYLQGTDDAKERALAAVGPPAEGIVEAALQQVLALPSDSGVDVKLRLNRNYDECCRSEAERVLLQKTIRAELSVALGVDLDRLEIERFGRGSVIVDFCILPASQDGEGGASISSEKNKRGKEQLDSRALAQLLLLQMADPTSKLRKCPTLSSATTLHWIHTPLIPAREAKRAVRRLAAEIDFKSKALRELKQEKDENESLLHMMTAAAIQIQRLNRGMKGRQASKLKHRQQLKAVTLQRVFRGHKDRKRVATVRAAMKQTDLTLRAALLQAHILKNPLY